MGNKKLIIYQTQLWSVRTGTNLHTELQHQKDEFVQDAFVAGDQSALRHETMSAIMADITCPTVGDTELCPYRCCLNHCAECPLFVEKRGDRNTNGLGICNFIMWTQHDYMYECRIHGSIGQETKCNRCERMNEEDRSTVPPRAKLSVGSLTRLQHWCPSIYG